MTAEPTPSRQALLAELLARTCGYLVTGHPDRSAALGERAVVAARAAGDERVLAVALLYSTQNYTLERDEHLARVSEAARLAEHAGDLNVLLDASTNLMVRALTWAERDEFDRALAEYSDVAGQLRAPTPLLLSAIDHAGAAALDGHYELARQQFEHAQQRPEPLDDPSIAAFIDTGLLVVDRELDLMGRRLPTTRGLAVARPNVIPLQAILVHVLAQTGDVAEARVRLDELLKRPDEIRHGFLRRFNMVLLAEAVDQLDHPAAAALLYPWLQDELPHGRCIIVGPNAFFGAVERCLGLLACTSRLDDDAVNHHEAALEAHDRLRGPGWVARSRYDLARALLRRGHPDDADRARSLLAQAKGAADQLGMPRLRLEATHVRTAVR